MTESERAIREALTNTGMLEWPSVTSADLSSILTELDKLRALCACAYQLAGVFDALLPWLDALSEAANGLPFSDDGLLPVGLEQLDAFGELQARCETAEALLRELRSEGRVIISGSDIDQRIDAHLNQGA
jgi:hypothetical protein